jgi:serine/threonine-protein kinase RsbW
VSRSTHTLTLPAATRSLADVRRFVAERAQEAHMERAAVEQIKLAVDEACANVVKHAYAGADDATFDVDVDVTGERFEVRIRDRGAAFDRSAYQQPNLARSIQKRRRGGLGVHLMQRLMDSVEYRTSPAGNEVRMVKYRNGARRGES